MKYRVFIILTHGVYSSFAFNTSFVVKVAFNLIDFITFTNQYLFYVCCSTVAPVHYFPIKGFICILFRA